MTPDDFWKILHDMPKYTPVSYKLYYVDIKPVIYSMEDLPGNYIEVDAETYALASFDVQIIDQVLVHVEPEIIVRKLRPNTDTGIACHPADVCIVVKTDLGHIKWSLNEQHK